MYQTLESMTEYYQGPRHEKQNSIAHHDFNELDIITALLVTYINPLAQRRIDFVLELKNNIFIFSVFSNSKQFANFFL
jgi:inositol 1,4,5-triphosphate receptor type 1